MSDDTEVLRRFYREHYAEIGECFEDFLDDVAIFDGDTPAEKLENFNVNLQAMLARVKKGESSL